ncbi:MAG: hypothetical protein NTV38_02570, partial [Chloroflexi bacterium]|nr:hypothetical protein [Chloroflexota bacterium]
MKQQNLTSTSAKLSSSRPQRLPRLRVLVFQRGGRQWLRILVSALVVCSILLSPVGSIPAHALDVPVLVGPADGSTITVDDSPPLAIPEFEWTAVPGATSYRLQV